jgi:hypothetical protein
MPRIIDYSVVQQRMQECGFVSLYHNSGAFGFPQETKVEVIGWIGNDDPTIRESARPLTRQIPPPLEPNLVGLLQQVVLSSLTTEPWLLPKSHWHYELHFGNRELLESLLPHINIDPADLRDRNDGSAIAFSRDETNLLMQTTQRLLEGLTGSDFLLAWPNQQTLCTIHHHKQLWWQSAQSRFSSILPEPGKF